jgi:hypothetical protein
MQFIGEGNRRKCFVYRDDPTKVIKVAKSISTTEAIEVKYYAMLEKRGVPFDHIVRFYGEDTVLDGDGKEYSGFVFERALNDDGTPAVILKTAIEENVLLFERVYYMLEYLQKRYLLKYAIVFGDCNLTNIALCRAGVDRDGSVAYRLLIIDGIGTKTNDWKLYLRLRFPILAREVQIRRWWRTRRKFQQEHYKKGRFTWFARFNWWWRLHFYLEKRGYCL